VPFLLVLVLLPLPGWLLCLAASKQAAAAAAERHC
jgi:hypothetical protein